MANVIEVRKKQTTNKHGEQLLTLNTFPKREVFSTILKRWITTTMVKIVRKSIQGRGGSYEKAMSKQDKERGLVNSNIAEPVPQAPEP